MPRRMADAPLRNGAVFTTGQVAKLFQVAPRTVAQWYDKGLLKGYTVPGGKDRRFTRHNLIVFAREHNLPCILARPIDGRLNVLVVGLPAKDGFDLAAHIDAEVVSVEHAADWFQAGQAMGTGCYDVVLFDCRTLGREMVYQYLPRVRKLSKARFVLLLPEDGPGPMVNNPWALEVAPWSSTILATPEHVANLITKTASADEEV